MKNHTKVNPVVWSLLVFPTLIIYVVGVIAWFVPKKSKTQKTLL